MVRFLLGEVSSKTVGIGLECGVFLLSFGKKNIWGGKNKVGIETEATKGPHMYSLSFCEGCNFA